MVRAPYFSSRNYSAGERDREAESANQKVSNEFYFLIAANWILVAAVKGVTNGHDNGGWNFVLEPANHLVTQYHLEVIRVQFQEQLILEKWPLQL